MKVIDLTYIKTIADDTDVIVSFIDIFSEQLVEFEASLNEAYVHNNWKQLAEIAHKAKSSIVSMGMCELGDAMKKLEMLAKKLYTELPLAIPNIVDDYEHQLIALPVELKKWINENKSIETVEHLINFYKLQAELAKADLIEFFECKCN